MDKVCNATGKVCFETYTAAKENITQHKLFAKTRRDLFGKRIKHRQGKPAQKRIYHCPHCNSYHQTKWVLQGYLNTYDLFKEQLNTLHLQHFFSALVASS